MLTFIFEQVVPPICIFIAGVVFAANLSAVMAPDPFFQPRVWKLAAAAGVGIAFIVVEVRN